jgi:CNT family concentrative nucleoside transporter
MRFVSILGLVALIGCAWAMSEHRSRFPWRIVMWGVGLQLVFAAIILGADGLSFAGMGALGGLLGVYLLLRRDAPFGDRRAVGIGVLVSVAGGCAAVGWWWPGGLPWIMLLALVVLLAGRWVRTTDAIAAMAGFALVASGVAWMISGGVTGRLLFGELSNTVASFLALSDYGARFLFGNLSDSSLFFTGPDAAWPGFGFQFAFKVLPTIIFFGGFMGVLYYLGVIQRVIQALARFMRWTVGTSGAETLSCTANIFVGQTEAPLLIKPFFKGMTRSELHTIMVGGFATIAGGVLAGYIALDIPAGHLIAASVMSAPAALVIGKVMFPETEHSETAGDVDMPDIDAGGNVVEAATNGITDGLKLAMNVGAMLIGFIALIAVIDVVLNFGDRMIDGRLLGGAWVEYSSGGMSPVNGEFEGWFPGSLQTLFGTLLQPLAWLMGVPWSEAARVGNLLGIKTVAERVRRLRDPRQLHRRGTALAARRRHRHLRPVRFRQLLVHRDPDRRHRGHCSRTPVGSRQARRAGDVRGRPRLVDDGDHRRYVVVTRARRTRDEGGTMIQRSKVGWIALLCAVSVCAGCDLLDPVRPSAVPDVEVFGNFVSLSEQPDAPGQFIVQIQVGPPRALERASEEEGEEPPPRSEGVVAKVLVTADTVVFQEGRPGDVEAISPGTEVVVVPMAGSSRMRGTTDLEVSAEAFMDFETYRRWRLPKLEGDALPIREDPAAINSDGVERGAVPVGDGSVLYFSARRRAPADADAPWQGARRDGLTDGTEASPPRMRSYRTEVQADGWTPPEVVGFAGLDEAVSVTVSWVAEDERSCLVTVVEGPGAPPWVGEAQRRAKTSSWGPVTRLDVLGEADAAGAHRLDQGGAQLVFASKRHGGAAEDLFILTHEDTVKRLDLEVNTASPEVHPRVGKANQLYFTRGDRAMTLRGDVVTEVRPGWPHRALVPEAAPTTDGRWVFLTVLSLAAGEPDMDLMVAPLGEDGAIGRPVPVDGWRPVSE